MQCPNCQAEYLEGDEVCKVCGSDLKAASTSLVPARSRPNLPAIFQRPQIPRLVAGVGAFAFGLGLELLRRNIVARGAKTALRTAPKLLPSPAFEGMRESLFPQQNKTFNVPKGYEIEETTIYINRVIRRRK
jgi:hypothetical protein